MYTYTYTCMRVSSRKTHARAPRLAPHGRAHARARLARALPACLARALPRAWPARPRSRAPAALGLRSPSPARGGGASVPRTCVRAYIYRYVYVPEPLARRKAARHGGASPAPPAPLLSLPPLRPTINPPPPRSLVRQGGGRDASLVHPAPLLLLLLWALARVAEAPSGG